MQELQAFKDKFVAAMDEDSIQLMESQLSLNG